MGMKTIKSIYFAPEDRTLLEWAESQVGFSAYVRWLIERDMMLEQVRHKVPGLVNLVEGLVEANIRAVGRETYVLQEIKTNN